MTGIEMIQHLMKEVMLLQQKVDLLDQNMKRLLNQGRSAPKKTPSVKPAEAPAKKEQAGQDGIKKFKFESSKLKKPCVCEGKMVVNQDGKQVPLSGLEVKIYNEKDELIKETKTNMAGFWYSHLKPGRFLANISGKHGNKPLYPINITFEVLPGMEKLEVK